MKTGFRGTYVISWSQTAVDGIGTAPVGALNVGASWSWHGDAVRVDGPDELLRLEQADADINIRKRAARMVHRLIGAAGVDAKRAGDTTHDRVQLENNFVVTDGSQSYTVTIIEVGTDAPPLLMFVNEMPPQNIDLWVVHQSYEGRKQDPKGPDASGVICFTPGTRITTAEGTQFIENLREGDFIQTKDNGAQEVLWIGSRRMSGARLFAMPRLRPVRIRAGALGIDRPDDVLLVSPEHRMLVGGRVAQALFNTDEVLVQAKDLINGTTVTVDSQLREVTYVHIMLANHQIVWANNVETESFHPSNTALSSLADGDRHRLLSQFPEFDYNPQAYGAHARRNLTESETAILLHDAA